MCPSEQQRVIYFGPPGTGKTYALMRHVEEALAQGIPPERIAFVAFSRKAAREARERAETTLGLTEDQLSHWSTLHSAAARQLGVTPRELLREQHWATLGESLGLKLEDVDEAGRPSGDTWSRERGKRVQAIHSLYRAKNWPLDYRALYHDYKEIGRLVDQYHRTLEFYKRRHGLLDYADLLEQAPGHLDVDVAFIDEAQDLTPAQWEYALRLVGQARQVYVAGDDDQAIYTWAGADVERFLSLEGERRVLGKSYRLPESVFSLSQEITRRIIQRQPKDWTHSGREGHIHRIFYPDTLDVTEGSWLLLARTQYQLSVWETLCRRAGVRYVRGTRDSVKGEDAEAIRAWEHFRRGEPTSGAALKQPLEYGDYDTSTLDPHERYTPRDLGWRDTPPIWHEFMERAIPLARREYYRDCLKRSSRALVEAPQVHLSTIHGVKGGEADNVALLTDLTDRVEQGMRRAPDDEHRVWYVAATRARENLYLVAPASRFLKYPI